MISKGLAWLDAQRRAHCSQPVTYSRGATSVSLAATPGSTRGEVATEEGLSVRADVLDWIITAADLVLGGQRTEPLEGDRIVTAAGVVHEVMSPGDPEPAWRWESGRRAFRVHCKEV